MDCVSAQSNYLDLKFEDSGDYYLINSYLGLQKNDEEGFIDQLIEDHPVGLLATAAHTNTPANQYAEQVVKEASDYVCFRTTSLRQIMAYFEQYYRIPQEKTKAVLAAARRLKLKMKRAHARQRNGAVEVRIRQEEPPIIPLEIKVEESELSPFVFEDQSQQTRKKKRNRMSAQNSRDRKKEYIRQIQNQNRELKRKLALAERKTKMQSSSRDFLKMILCLGITCYANIHRGEQIQPQPYHPIAEEMTTEEKNYISLEGETFSIGKAHLPLQVKLLKPAQQLAIAELMENLSEGRRERGKMQDMHQQCTDLVSEEAASEKSTSSEGRKSPKSQFL